MVKWRAASGRTLWKAALRRRSRLRRLFAQHGRRRFEYEILRVLWDCPRTRRDIASALTDELGYCPLPKFIHRTLQRLEDRGCITVCSVGVERVLTISDSGSKLLAEHLEGGVERQINPGSAERLENLPFFTRGVRALSGLSSGLKRIARSRNLDLYADALTIVENAYRKRGAPAARE